MYLRPRHISWPMAQLHNEVLLFLILYSKYPKTSRSRYLCTLGRCGEDPHNSTDLLGTVCLTGSFRYHSYHYAFLCPLLQIHVA